LIGLNGYPIQWVGKKQLEDKEITVVQFDEYIKKESL
jgi:hypothetical protein